MTLAGKNAELEHAAQREEALHKQLDDARHQLETTKAKLTAALEAADKSAEAKHDLAVRTYFVLWLLFPLSLTIIFQCNRTVRLSYMHHWPLIWPT
jgi:hypothetical protein